MAMNLEVQIDRVDRRGWSSAWAGTRPTTIDGFPLVYLLYRAQDLYIGETSNVDSRFAAHKQHTGKKGLDNRLLIHSPFFNKSVALNLEAFLISSFFADPYFKLVNVKQIITSHNYYDKGRYEALFPDIWNRLLEMKLASLNQQEISNSDLFKYSPYKRLNEEQQQRIIDILEGMLKGTRSFFLHGGAGTGKTILAVFLIKLLATPAAELEQAGPDDAFSQRAYELLREIKKQQPGLDEKIAMVVPVSPLRATLQKVFAKAEHLSRKMVISPTEAAKGSHSFLLIDESQRLRRRKNLSHYGSFDETNEILGTPDADELDWVISASKSRLFFYDDLQSVRPSDVPKEKFAALRSAPTSQSLSLLSQIRCKGGNLYSSFVNRLLDGNLNEAEVFQSADYQLHITDDIRKLRSQIADYDRQFGLCRTVAGFAWEHRSKKKSSRHIMDIQIDGLDMQWNAPVKDWINSKNALQEVGCIHTTQGYDLNYVGIIFGKDIGYDRDKKQIIVRKSEYCDRNGKNTATEEELKAFITNIYKTLMLRGIKGTLIYCCDRDLEQYFQQHIQKLA